MRVLLIEDNQNLAANIVDYLEMGGYTMDAAADGLTGLHLASTESFDAILLDLALPGIDGVTLCQRLRAARNTTPILMLTAKGDIEERVDGLEAGGDDYLVKPVALAELDARIRAQVRRARGGLERLRLRIDDLELDEETREVFRANTRLNLTRVDFTLLQLLMRESPRVVPRQRLEREVWGESLPDSDTLRSHIHRLRRAVDRPFGRALIHTAHGVGYRLVGRDAVSP